MFRYIGVVMIGAVGTVGRVTIDAVSGFGQFAMFCLSTLRWLVLGVGRWGRWSLLMPQLYQIGSRSIGVVGIVGAFIGMVLAVEIYDSFASIGFTERIGGIINISVVKQIGPVMAAVMLAGRVGGSISAEVGTMRVTEQIDALHVMGADPIAYLVLPRVIACVVMTPILNVFADLLGVAGGYFITVQVFGVSHDAYWDFSRPFVDSWDVCTGLIKSVFFGLAIGLISCYKGFYCRSGAEGVGRAATDAFVTSFIAIIIGNFFLAMFLKAVYELFGTVEGTAFG